MRTCGEEKVHSKVAVFLVNLSNRNGGKSETITISPFKRKSQQDQEKITKTNNNQIKPKQKKNKIETKITSKNKDAKKKFFNKRKLANKH